MAKATGKHSFAKSTIIWGLVGLVAVALTVNFLWASSPSHSSTYVSIASALSRPRNYLIFVQNITNGADTKKVHLPPPSSFSVCVFFFLFNS